MFLRPLLRARVSRKRLIFTCTTGRSGTGYLAKLLECVPAVASSHEPEPRFSHHLRAVQRDPRRALDFWLEEKLPAIAAKKEPVVVETSHLFCKGFLEPLVQLAVPFDLIILRRDTRLVAKSLHQLDTIPGRTDLGRTFLLAPSDPGVLLLPDWERLDDYQLCYWYCLEIERRAEQYARLVTDRCGRVAQTTLDRVAGKEGFIALLDALALPRPTQEGWARYEAIAGTQVNRKAQQKERSRRPEIERLEDLEAEVRRLVAPGDVIPLDLPGRSFDTAEVSQLMGRLRQAIPAPVRRAVPAPAKRAVRLALEQVDPLTKLVREALPGGKSRWCPLCGEYARRFNDYGTPPRPEALCPSCGALERHRLISFFFERETDLFDHRPKRMLHFAPERCLAKRLESTPALDYVTVDLHRSAKVTADITDLPFEDDSFDVVYCSHVLEHVVDDKKAMRELRRVLRPHGWSVLVVPITSDRIIEDPNVTDPAERLRLYGQEDHVRRYGPDFQDRLEECGFKVRCYVASDFLDDRAISQSAVRRDERFHHCTKA